ncbi:GNAT family N-acetyltransferase [Streptomyces sp. MUM 203J]|uniref:GNAT family N-acetyltransferase n=1 Tax=Streptomyces sp. MUM 203J TaxID=2791990 RepID=UPI001F04A789|nr:GNAT family N-acetyltransferase [Streptomyces sp. MUM 203J]MCH0543072.1 GNAT family N-acetyltransferase [Streptomyces sp. MUM 203J]
MEPVTLTSDRLHLGTFTPGDAEEVHTACQDPDIQRWIPVPSPYREQDAEEFVSRYVPGAWRADTEYTFSVRPREGGPLLAATSLHHPRGGTWEIGYWTAKEHRGNGYATEMVRTVAAWAFTGLGCGRLEWRAEVGNTGSRRVAEQSGFTLEGVLRAGLGHRGTHRDCWIGSLLPSDLGLPGTVPYLPPKS